MEKQDIDNLVRSARQALNEQRFEDARGIYGRILQLDPAQPRAWLALSALAQRDGNYRDSVRSARSAGEAWRRSGNHAFLTEVSMRLLVLSEYQLARDLIAQADWSDPVVLRYSMGLVQYLGLAEAHEEALALADHAIARIGDAPAALIHARANALRYLGRMHEATEAYEQCVAMDPLHAEAHWALAHHEPSSRPGSRVSRLRKAVSHVAADSEDAIYLQYALFKELDDAGEVAEAWKALELGARMKRQKLRHDPAADERRYQALMELCNPEFFHAPATDADATTHTPVFIVGLPRSGTTLLERMLGGHPSVRSGGELNDFTAQMSWEADRFLTKPLSAAGLNAAARIDFTDLGRGYLQRTEWRAKGASMLIDKLPNNVLHAGFIHRALPEARIICVRRNPMDSCFSTYKHLFSGDAYAYSYDLREMSMQYRRFENLVEHWTQVLPDRWWVVDYEDLVSDPNGWAHRLADCCGLRFDDAMVRIEDNAEPSSTASTSQIRQPVHGRNVGSWQRYARWLQVADETT